MNVQPDRVVLNLTCPNIQHFPKHGIPSHYYDQTMKIAVNTAEFLYGNTYAF